MSFNLEKDEFSNNDMIDLSKISRLANRKCYKNLKDKYINDDILNTYLEYFNPELILELVEKLRYEINKNIGEKADRINHNYHEGIKSCPNCNSTNLRIDSTVLYYDKTDGGHWVSTVVCDSCGMRGPLEGLDDNAIKSWNNLPRSGEIYDLFK